MIRDRDGTPDFGTFALDDRGETVIPLAIEHVIECSDVPHCGSVGSPARPGRQFPALPALCHPPVITVTM